MIHYLIDGNNLFGKMKNLPKSPAKNIDEREYLVLTLDRFFYGRNCKVFLYFDGFMKTAIRSHKVKIIYSNAETADSVIKYDISHAKNPRNLYVISSDNEIYSFAKVCSCKAQTSEEFLDEIQNKFEYDFEEKPEPSKNEVDYFKKLFGEE